MLIRCLTYDNCSTYLEKSFDEATSFLRFFVERVPVYFFTFDAKALYKSVIIIIIIIWPV